MPDSQAVLEFVRDPAIFDHQYSSTWGARVVGHKGLILFIGRRASRALRAMLENNDWIFVRTFEELLQVTFPM